MDGIHLAIDMQKILTTLWNSVEHPHSGSYAVLTGYVDIRDIGLARSTIENSCTSYEAFPASADRLNSSNQSDLNSR
jgi:hypothetical protein